MKCRKCQEPIHELFGFAGDWLHDGTQSPFCNAFDFWKPHGYVEPDLQPVNTNRLIGY